jgi:hypothetical protein
MPRPNLEPQGGNQGDQEINTKEIGPEYGEKRSNHNRKRDIDT